MLLLWGSLMRNSKIRKVTRLALFLAIGVVLNIIESLVPLPIPIPGIKLGLANTIGLIVLYFFGAGEYLLIGFLRVLLVGLLRTGIASPAFFLSLGGYILSSLVTLIFYFTLKPSIFGLSVVSALFHPVGQIIIAIIYYNQIYFINYLPILLISGVVTGVLVALIASRVLPILSKGFKRAL